MSIGTFKDRFEALRSAIVDYWQLFDDAAKARKAVEALWPPEKNEELPGGHPLVVAMWPALAARNDARDRLHGLLDRILERR